MVYHVLFIYTPYKEPERWVQGHKSFEWDTRPVTWEEMQLVYRFLKLHKQASHVYIYGIKTDAEYQAHPHRCVYSKGPRKLNKEEEGEYGDVACGSGSEN